MSVRWGRNESIFPGIRTCLVGDAQVTHVDREVGMRFTRRSQSILLYWLTCSFMATAAMNHEYPRRSHSHAPRYRGETNPQFSCS
jgi:hypothetical protein